MTARHLIAAADPARALPREALGLDVDAMLHEFAAQPAPVPPHGEQRSAPLRHRRHRLDLALAAVVVAFLAAVAFLPGSLTHGEDAGTRTSTSTPAASSAEGRAAADALLDGIDLPSAAKRVTAPPTHYLSKAWIGLSCKGTVSAQPRLWIVPNTTLRAVAQYLKTHLPAGAGRLPFNQDTTGDISSAFTSYRPSTRSQVVIALATTPTGVGIRADADLVTRPTCVER